MPPLTPEQRNLRARVASYARWAREPDRHQATQAARDGRWQRYLERARELAPDGATDDDIHYRAEVLRKADMTRMALASARARRARGKGGAPDEAA